MILKLPTELLVNIFEYLQNYEYQESYHFASHSGSGDHVDIKNIRLTCQRFAETSSHLLLAHIDVELTLAGLQRLEEISRVPGISNGITSVRIYVQCYSQHLSDDLGFFVSVAAQRLERQRQATTTRYMNQEYWIRAQNYSMVMAEDVVTQAKVMVKSWESYPGSKAVEIGKELMGAWHTHKQCHAEQTALLQNDTFARSIALSLARMPKLTRMSITDEDWRLDDRSVTLPHLIIYPERGNSMADVIDSMMIQPLKWGDACQYSFETEPTTLLSAIPLALLAQGVLLTALNISVTPSVNFDLRIGDEDVTRLSLAAQNIRHFSFETPIIDTQVIKLIDGDVFASLRKYLSGMMNPTRLENLNLNFTSLSCRPESPDDADHLFLSPAAWPGLRTVSLVRMSIHFSAFQRFMRRTGSGTGESTTPRRGRADVCLRRVTLPSEHTADVLDFMREECGPASEIIHPIVGDISRDEYRHAFINEPPARFNRATEYIQHRTNENPLRI